MNATTDRPTTAPRADTVSRPAAAPRGHRPDLVTGEDGLARCAWATSDAEYQRYHDEEWGVPLREDRGLFEKICLEGFQAGLSWRTILLRRPAFREVFHGFDVERVAAMDERDVERLLQDATIIRHRGKIEATIANARATLTLQQPLHELVWSFAPAARPAGNPGSMAEIPAVTSESTALSRRLRANGYRFVGPTTMYALMQSSGLVDDHIAGCWRAAATASVGGGALGRR